MNTIYKYELEIIEYQEILMPKGARILTVQSQNGKPVIWVLINLLVVETELRVFKTITTGEQFNIDMEFMRHIGTYQLHDGKFVAHVFTKDYQIGFFI